MKRFTGFVYKEILHIFRDYRTLLIIFGIPVIQILIFGFVVSNEIRDVNIAILDYSRDRVTREITGKILAPGYFRLERYLNNYREIEPAFKSGKIKQVLIFEPGFEEKFSGTDKAGIHIIADASDANTGRLIANYTQGIIMDHVLKENMISSGKQPVIVPETRMMFNQELKGVYMFVPGTMALILIIISALMTSISITREKEFGTMETLLVSPLKPYQIILGKVTPYFLLSFINATMIIILARLVFGMPVTGSYSLLFLCTVLYILLALSLGIFISTVSNSQQSAMMISLFVLLLPTLLLSGFIFPVENMPLILQWLSEIIPTKWFIILLKHLMLKGSELSIIYPELVKLALMTLLFIGLSIKRFKVRME